MIPGPPITMIGDVSWALGALVGAITVVIVLVVILRSSALPLRSAVAVAALGGIAVLALATGLGDALGFF